MSGHTLDVEPGRWAPESKLTCRVCPDRSWYVVGLHAAAQVAAEHEREMQEVAE
jgi:hypothetical protein